MITSVEIKGLRGIQEGKLTDFTPLVILVGTNGSGKSTVLDALLIGSNVSPAYAVGNAVARHKDVDEGTRWLLFQGNNLGKAQLKVADVTGIERECTLEIDPLVINGDLVATEDQRIVWCEVTDKYAGQITFTDKVGTRFRGNTPSAYLGNVQMLPNPRSAQVIEPSTNYSQETLVQLYSRTVEQGRRDQANALMKNLLPGFSHLEMLIPNKVPTLYVVFAECSIPAALVGDGIRTLLNISLELASFANGVAFVEEPEVHQHPGAIRQTARAIWAAIRRGLQVFISTHSLDLIDALLSEVQNPEELERMSVYQLLLREGCLKSSRLNGSDVAFARTEIADDLR